jgi:4-hydroxythreonine-4-phosphate dehydrogenase
MEEQIIKVGVTHGDINGIGYEIILKTFADIRIAELCTPIIYGSLKIAAYHRKVLDLPPLNMSSISKAEDAEANRINIINCANDETKVELGQPSEMACLATLQALDTALNDLTRGTIDVLVTAPADLRNIPNPNTCFLNPADYLEKKVGNKNHALMMLINNDLRIALVTGDIPLSEAPSKVTRQLIVEKLLLFNQSLTRDFSINKARIAVLSLNPHTTGKIGVKNNEEEEIIIPAMQEAEKQGVLSFGPYAANSFFGSQIYEKFDGVLAMYHDQGFTPFKALSTLNGLNYTAGLPIVHTSPIHGTAYDIAGKNMASEESFRQAIYTALDIFRNRKMWQNATKNSLKRHFFERGVDERIDLSRPDEGTEAL